MACIRRVQAGCKIRKFSLEKNRLHYQGGAIAASIASDFL
jgi:hypothetical protein